MTWNNLALLDSGDAQRGGTWDADRHDARNKLLTRQIGRFPTFGLDPLGYHCLNTVFMISPREGVRLDPYFLMGVLNSSFLRAYWVERFWDRRRTFPKIKGTFLKQLPIPDPTTNAGSAQRVTTCARELTRLASGSRRSGRSVELEAREVVTLEAQLDSEVAAMVGADATAISDALSVLA